MKNTFIIMPILILALLISACSRDEISDTDNYSEDIEVIEKIEEIEETEKEITTRTLTIRGSGLYRSVINQALIELNRDWTQKGYSYILEIDFQEDEPITSPEELTLAVETRPDRLRIELMAGMGPDLILDDGGILFLYQFAQAGHLMDFRTLIDNCPVTSRDDFFMNVLEAYEFFGGIHGFPLKFDLSYIGINTNMPQHFIDRFAGFEYLGLSDIMSMYLEYLDNYDVFTSHRVLSLNRLHPFLLNINHFIDFNTRTADFNKPELIDLLELSIQFLQRANYQLMSVGIPINSIDVLRELAENNMFFEPTLGHNPADAFLRRDIPFNHFLPFVDDYGHFILASPVDVWIVATENSELAWEFTRYLIEIFSTSEAGPPSTHRTSITPWGRGSFGIPIKRNLFERHMRGVFNQRSIRDSFEFDTTEDFNNAVDIAIAKMYEYANMPMALRSAMIPPHLISVPFDDFALGLITAAEALNRMQNAVSLWLIE